MDAAINYLPNEFKENLIQVSTILQELGYNIAPYHNPSLTEFNSLTKAQQEEVNNHLVAYLNALKSEYKKTEFNEENVLLQFLFRTGYAPTPETSDLIRNEKYIQIYSRDQLQIYRSLSCFQRCSFSLEQLTTRPWYSLWERESLFYFACVGLATTALKIIRFTKIRLEFPFHRVTETNSPKSFSFDYKIKSLTALVRRGRLHAALLIEDWRY